MNGKILTQTGDKIQEDLDFNEGLFPYFSTSSTYAVGAFVRYEDKIYRCHTAVASPGAWSGNTNWEVKDIPGVIDSVVLGAINASY